MNGNNKNVNMSFNDNTIVFLYSSDPQYVLLLSTLYTTYSERNNMCIQMYKIT